MKSRARCRISHPVVLMAHDNECAHGVGDLCLFQKFIRWSSSCYVFENKSTREVAVLDLFSRSSDGLKVLS